jgi:hypothetical protein
MSVLEMPDEIIQPKRHTPPLKGSLKNLLYPPERSEYRYFERAVEHLFTTGDTIVKAAWAADSSLLAYARYGPQRMTDEELRLNLSRGRLELRAKIGPNPQDWNAPGTQAWFATGDGFGMLAFRGGEVDDPDDIRAAINITLALEPEHRPAGDPKDTSPLAHLFSIPCLVHRGFQAELDQVWDQVVEQLTDYRTRYPMNEICITGHSLGATAGLLTYSRLTDPNVSLFTFGCPRIGNTVFRDRVAANIGRGHFRCVNLNDVITHLPIESVFYVHAPATCHRFDEAGALHRLDGDPITVNAGVLEEALAQLSPEVLCDIQKLDDLPAPPGAVEHSPARYSMRVWDLV